MRENRRNRKAETATRLVSYFIIVIFMTCWGKKEAFD
jgi:hypothetical protein